MSSEGSITGFTPPSLSPQKRDKVGGSPPSLLTKAEKSAEEDVTFRGDALETTGGALFTTIFILACPEPAKFVAVIFTSKTPTSLFNGMIAPIAPYTLRGTIWYQGEANVGRAKQYLGLTELLITDWREQFNNKNMPFYYVQLAPYHYHNAMGTSSASIREAQRRALKIPNTGMAVTLDVGNIKDIHPANKIAVGERLAFWALANDYDKELEYSGPLPSKVERKDNKIVIYFDHATVGLKIRKNVANQFEIAGNDGKFVPAQVKVLGDKIEVFATGISSPAEVRYAFRNGAEASLFNGEGLPAPSFTTEENYEK